jgi:MYXO-CTERM domain-containing protein
LSGFRSAVSATVCAILLLLSLAAQAKTVYVARSGSDSASCSEQSPCATIRKGIDAMAGGDTLVIGDGTYTQSVTDMPSGSASAYTTVRAEHDWGVTIDGTGFPDDYQFGIEVSSKHHVVVRGIHVKMKPASTTNEPITVAYSDHVKIQRCSGSYAPTDDNAATIDVGPTSSYVLIEECYAFGGGRYQFLVYQSDHVIVRRSVARHDYWTGSLQCAGFTNYDSVSTVWQNNIVLDSDEANCKGHLYGGFFNENKTDYAPDTSQLLQGNIVLNVKAYYAGDFDTLVSGTRTIEDMIIWGSSGGYQGDGGNGIDAHIDIRRLTVGAIYGKYDGPNEGAGHGTGVSIYSNKDNRVTHSVFSACSSVGVADYAVSDYNAFNGNGTNYGGQHKATAGAHDITASDLVTPSLRYLPRIEPGSPLKTAGEGGAQVGAEVMFKTGATGSLHGEPGWDQQTAEPLWPFPNEAEIKADMASYTGPGGIGARGFATGTSRDGTPQTLTKYIWEYLGNQIPDDIYAGVVTPKPDGGSPSRDDGGTSAPADDGGAEPGPGPGTKKAVIGSCNCRVGAGDGAPALVVCLMALAVIGLRRRRRGG